MPLGASLRVPATAGSDKKPEQDIKMKIALAMAAAVIAILGQPSNSFAQYQGDAPFCVQIYTADNMITRCEYQTFAQCQALNDGRNNTCAINPYYKGPPAAAPQHRQRQGY